MSISTRMKALYELCSSNDLSPTTLRNVINKFDETDIQNYMQHYENEYPFLHEACLNENVTLEVIKLLIYTFPGVAIRSTDQLCPEGETQSYPLHMACTNDKCPDTVIELLLNICKDTNNVTGLKTFAMLENGLYSGADGETVLGLPLHYYLSRRDVNIDTVRMLVDAYPRCLSEEYYDFACYPIHVILSNPHTTHWECPEILEYFLKREPSSIRMIDGWRRTPLQVACHNYNMAPKVVRSLLNEWPESVHQVDIIGNLPIHTLCSNNDLDDDDRLEILQLLLDTDPACARARDESGDLPIHRVACNGSPEICKALIDIYPEPVRDTMDRGSLPIHDTCCSGRVDTVEYLLQLYPDSVHVRDESGSLPIHNAAAFRSDGGQVKLFELLLGRDPLAISEVEEDSTRRLPLHLVCSRSYQRVDGVQYLYDAYPEAIFIRDAEGKTPIDLAESIDTDGDSNEDTEGWAEVIAFLQTQRSYALKARDMSAMIRQDEKGWLPLHRALKDNAPLGSIKLLIKGNPSAIRTVDDNLAFPLHIACQYSSVEVVRHLVELDSRIPVGHLDRNKDSVLHYACCRGNLEVIKHLIESHASLVSNTNADDKLPFHLLLECEDEQVRESLEFTEACFQLLRAHPETVTMQTSTKRRRY